MKSKTDSSELARRPTRRGFWNRGMVRGVSLWTTGMCILVAVCASLLAVWEFTGTDVLWRTVASRAVVAGGAISFSWANLVFGEKEV